MDTHAVQTQYWSQFTRLKRDAIYIGKYQEKVEGRDRLLNMFTAIASSAAIGSWVIWKDYAWIWGSVIAASQVLTAIKPFLPYQARLKALEQFCRELDNLAISAETDWLAVSRLSISDVEIHGRTMMLKKKALEAQHKSFSGASLPEDPKLVEAADKAAAAYMETYVIPLSEKME